jgi:5'-3' exonuclease
VWLTGKNNFRDKVAKTLGYKANRKDTDKPVHYDTIREHLITHHKAEVVDGMEADDMLGIRQNNETVIASIDKDLLMIPGHQFNLNDKTIRFVKDPGHLELIRNHGKSPKLIGSGFKWFCAQMLLGDSVDNIQGIKGLGPVRAFNALHPLKTELLCWRMVQKLYVEHDATERLMENANLLWILRTEDQYIKDFLLDLYARSEHGC